MSPRTALVVGSGPNGLAAAIRLAQGGCRVTVREAAAAIGGGVRSAELTLPGFTHDLCSAIHPLAVASPFFRTLPLHKYGLEWVEPPSELAHPLDDGSVILLDRSIEKTAAQFGEDAAAYQRLYQPMVAHADQLLDNLLRPILPPRHPLQMAIFGLKAIQSAQGFSRRHFRTEKARALFAGCAGHSVLPLGAPASASFGLMLNFLAHHMGWPFPRGGSQMLANALAAHLRELGGEIFTNHPVTNAAELTDFDVVLFDISPRQLIEIGGDAIPANYRQRINQFRPAPAAFKIDWALRAPIPWRASDCNRAATVHLGGSADEIAIAEQLVANGEHAERPFVLLAQPSLFDTSRAPAGMHTAWAYCHVPNGSSFDMSARIESTVERFAPGFQDLIVGKHIFTPADLQQYNANYLGGDVVGGANDLWQLLARPVLSLNPYRIPVDGWFLCSASTPPGGGVHGMAGFNAAQAALKHLNS